MRIAFASDHAGFRYKTRIAQHVALRGHEVVDFGTTSPDPIDYAVCWNEESARLARMHNDANMISQRQAWSTQPPPVCSAASVAAN